MRAGFGRAHLHDALQIDQSGVNEVKREADGGFETDDAKRRLVKFNPFRPMMRRVVGGDRVDRTVFHCFVDRIDVIGLRNGGPSWCSCRTLRPLRR